MNKFNNKNYASKLRRFIRGKNRTAIRGKFSTKVSRSNYSFPILSDPIIWDTSYSLQNLRINIYEQLVLNAQFVTLSKMYQYYKLNAVALKVVPKPVSGTYPPTAWAYLTGSDNDNIEYASIPRLPGSKVIKGNKTQTLYFRRIGRQDDFGWYKDTVGEYPSVSIRVRFAEPPAQNYKIMFQLKFFVTFNMMLQKQVANKIEEEEVLEFVPKPEIKEEVIKFMQLKATDLNESKISNKSSSSGWSEMSNNTSNSKLSKKQLESLEKVKQEKLKREQEEKKRKLEREKKKKQMLEEIATMNALVEDRNKYKKIKKQKVKESKTLNEEEPKLHQYELLTGEIVKSEQPIDQKLFNQLNQQAVDKIKDPVKKLDMQISGKPKERQVEILQKALPQLDEFQKAQVNAKIARIQEELANDLLNES